MDLSAANCVNARYDFSLRVVKKRRKSAGVTAGKMRLAGAKLSVAAPALLHHNNYLRRSLVVDAGGAPVPGMGIH
jgi:hypothetical protein